MRASFILRFFVLRSLSTRHFSGVHALSTEDAEYYLKEIVERTPAGHIGKPEDIANAVLFLCNSSAEYVYGHIFVVDGGLSLF